MNIKLLDSISRRQMYGEIEFIDIDPTTKKVIKTKSERNLIKIFSKEIMAHRIAHTKVWDPTANTGSGGWVNSGLDPHDEMSIKYIVFGASFNESGQPLSTSDTRYYAVEPISGASVPIKLRPGADYNGGLINAIPINEPDRPLKRIERIYFEPSYQPSGVPYLQEDTRAINNRVVFETTLLKDEYNGFGTTTSNFFTITEVALVSGIELGATGACECDPRSLFLTGKNGDPVSVTASGTATIIINPSQTSWLNFVKEGDQIKLGGVGGTAGSSDPYNQVSPYYLVVRKQDGGGDITLDRVPVDSHNNPIIGELGAYKDGFRIYAHRVLESPYKKSGSVETIVRWRMTMA